MLAQKLGNANIDFANVDEIIELSSFGREVSEDELNYVLSAIVGMRPQNPMQTLLAIQMLTNHKLLLENARQAASSTTLLERESALQAHHKLNRNSATLAEVFQRLQSGGQQAVQNVSISDGSQAIVGNVTQVRNELPPVAPPPSPILNCRILRTDRGGSGCGSERRHGHGVCTEMAPVVGQPTLRGEDPIGQALPVASSLRQTALPYARRCAGLWCPAGQPKCIEDRLLSQRGH